MLMIMNPIRLWFYFLAVHFLPETRFFGLKVRLLRWCGATIGKNVRIASSARFLGNGRLFIDDDVWIGSGCFISPINTAEIRIGEHVDIAPQVMLITGSHEIDAEGCHMAGKGYSKSIKIGDGCWLGARSIVLPGVSIAPKTILASGSIMTDSNDDEKCLWAGVPARKKKQY